MQRAHLLQRRTPKGRGWILLGAFMLTACGRSEHGGAATTSATAVVPASTAVSASPIPSVDTSIATSASVAAQPFSAPAVQELPDIGDAVDAEIDLDGWAAAARRRGAPNAAEALLELVSAKWGETPERVGLPCNDTGLIASNLAIRRIVWADGKPSARHLHIWQNQDVGASVDGPFIGGAVGTSQVLVTTGMVTRGELVAANGPFAVRYKNGSWSSLTLPGPAEKDWQDCEWRVAAKRRSDDFTLLQICAAPHRPLAYALYRLEADSAEAVRIPFDNALFDPVRARRDVFAVEDDGTIDLGSDVPEKLTLARLRAGKDDWEVVDIRMPSGASMGASGDRILVTTASGVPHESLDDGKSFRSVLELTANRGTIDQCIPMGCLLRSWSPSRALVWRWSKH